MGRAVKLGAGGMIPKDSRQIVNRIKWLLGDQDLSKGKRKNFRNLVDSCNIKSLGIFLSRPGLC